MSVLNDIYRIVSNVRYARPCDRWDEGHDRVPCWRTSFPRRNTEAQAG
jgi:hypothetical protein